MEMKQSKPFNKRILVIDDNRDILETYKDILSPTLESIDQLRPLAGKTDEPLRESFDLVLVSQGQEGFECVIKALEEDKPFTAAFIDMRMPQGWDGLETAQKIRESDNRIYIIIVTGYADYAVDEIHEAVKHNVLFVWKPFSEEEIYQLARNFCQSWYQDYELGEYRNKLEKMVEERTNELVVANESLQSEVAERKQAEEELSKLSNAIQQSADSVIITDKEGVIEFVNPAFEKITGYTKEEAIGKTPGILRSGKQDQKFYEKLWKTVLSGKVFRETIINKKKNGELFWDEKVIAPIIDKQGTITHYVATGKDVTERKKAEEEIYQSREQLRALAARLQSIREEEQTRISRELHDELGHSLTALKIDLVALSKDPLIKSKPQADDLQSMISLTDHSLQTVKRIATELRPGVLDQLGLGAAIEWQSKEFQSHTQIKCEIRLPEERLGLDKDKDIILFRILQEALTNVARHAQATNIVITLQKDKQSISMTVQDDGRGIKESEVIGVGSLGLLGMRERAHVVGGKLTITGEKGKGTTISVSVPID